MKDDGIVWENGDAGNHSEVRCDNGSEESFSKHMMLTVREILHQVQNISKGRISFLAQPSNASRGQWSITKGNMQLQLNEEPLELKTD
ncbi:hypothetical protein TNCV_2330101 [Trichonephila clavipes]|nr:hypothetical protein TNCV_2330101 [Trichonephila clavipes]